ncbi:MAG: alpha-2-macroglobulin family protein [Caulobacteraceae bacterium]|nr:alpha-2-macroglobulin family protein [Caulobacteraceae bacterium]
MNRTWAAAAIAALVVGFGGGFIVAKGLDGAFNRMQAKAPEQGLLWGMFGHPRSAGAPRRGIAKPDGFAIWKTRFDTAGAQPLACIEMTRPLDPAKAYGDFVLVSPDLGHAPAVSVRDDELCVGGVGFTDRQITLLKGLPARDGETLEANADAAFSNGDKPPYVGFAGAGVILPREDSDGVGIETVNVTKLAVEVWRVADRNLVRQSISAPDPTSEGGYASDYGDDSPNDEGHIVWKGKIDIKGDPGSRTTTVFPLGAVLKEMKPGGYVIKARDASGGRDLAAGEDDEGTTPAQARRWVIFTDMALIGYSGQDALDVVVRSLKTARPLAGVPVSLVSKSGEDLGKTVTDAAGRATFAHSLLEGENGLKAKMVMAYGPQGDLAVLDLDRSPIDLSRQNAGAAATGAASDVTAGRSLVGDIDGYLYADRGIYRPGETVRLTSLIRDRQARAVGDRKGEIVVLRPSGLEFRRFAFSGAPGGALATDIALPRTAPRGRWTADLRIDGYKDPAGKVSFEVQDFAPQRLAVTADGQASAPVAGAETRKIDVTARFLYGAVGSGLQTQGDARLRRDPNPFPAYGDYRWGDETAAFEEKELDLGSTVTDGAGHASLALDGSQAGDTVEPLMAVVTAQVFEPGGRPVAESTTLKVRPKALYLGVKVDQGNTSGEAAPPVTLDVIAVDAAGARIAAPGVSYRLVSENWTYDWYQQDGQWQWRRTNRDVVVSAGAVEVGAGQPARVPSRRLGWGDYRLELTGADGARTVVRFSPGWGGAPGDAETPDSVLLTAGSKSYAQGDTVAIEVKSRYAGEAQVAVATDRLIDFKTFSVGKGGTVVRLKTSAAWGGGAYVLVSVVQPRDPVASPQPRRALGLLYVPLDPKGRRLTVELGTPDKIDSKAPVVVPMRVRGLGFGQSAHLTVAAVDEGILRLTKAASPDPVGWYFGKRALTLDYRDDYGRLLDPNLGAPANVNFGGDQLGGEGLTVTPIKTVALWSGIVTTGADGRATVTLPAADFNGQLRIMAVAWTDGAVGSADRELTVRQPVIADLNLPRFIAPGDKPFATLELQNLEGRPGGYVAQTRGTGGILAAFRHLFQLVLGQRLAIHIPFAAPASTGIGQVGFTVAGPGFSTSKVYPIQSRLGWGAVTRTITELQQPGQTYTPPPGLVAGLYPGNNGALQVQVSYSPFKGFDPGPIAVSLSEYPYGCTEQLVSTAFPLLYATEVSADPKLRRTPQALNDAVGQLLDRQSMDGAFGLWRVGDGEADPWLGAYVTDFLLEARARGAAVPQEAVDKALNAMRLVSLPDSSPSVGYRLDYPDWWGANADAAKAATARLRSRASAYALYVLAKAGRGDLARLRWWHDVQMKSEGSPLAIAQVGAGLALMGDRARARDAFEKAAAALAYKRPLLQIGPLAFTDDYDWYQSPLRDLAAIIALSREAGQLDIAGRLEPRLEGAVRDPDDLNTQEKAQLLRAAHFMLAAVGPIRVQAGGAVAAMTSGGLTPRWAVNGRLLDAHFVNAGARPLWRTVTVRGVPVAPPDAEQHGISVEKTYFSFSGGTVNLASVKQGDRIIVRLAGASQQGRTVALAVDDALPAGFEIETVLGPDDADKGPFKFLGSLTAPKAQETRDDRYVASLDLAGHKTFALAYVARAVTPGDFYLPGVQALDMYHAGIEARSRGGRLAVAPGA